MESDDFAAACRQIGISEQTLYRWRKEYGGLKVDQAGG
jgi:putative transposase